MIPIVAAYTYLWGQHDYNANPFTPLGCKVEAYLYPGIRETLGTTYCQRVLPRKLAGALLMPRNITQQYKT
jgi:hypothetical protein